MPSDLDLVAEAMASSEPKPSPQTQPSSRQTQPSAQANGASSTNGNAPTNGTSSLPPDISHALSTLSPTELASLAPLLAALEADEEGMNVADLLAQMDQANGVADKLEERLDGLLGELRRAGEELEKEAQGGAGAQTSERDDGVQGQDAQDRAQDHDMEGGDRKGAAQ